MENHTETFTPESLYEKLKNIQVDNPSCNYTLDRCRHLAPLVNEILAEKKKQNAIILAHSYVHPDIIYTVADFTGDSLGLAKEAMNTKANTIVFPAVRFMAETAKILNPQKTVLDPNRNGGCTLADSITADEVLELRKQYPEHTFVCYVNTTAAVKAVCDVSVTSANVYTVIEKIPNDKIFFLPDELMGKNIVNELKKRGIKKEVLYSSGKCYVHEEFTPEEVDLVRSNHPEIEVLVHPECKPDVVAKADVVSSTTGMVDYVKKHATPNKKFMLLTECGLSARMQVEIPGIKTIGSCMLCRFMKSNSLESILRVLKTPQPNEVVSIEESIREKAYSSLHNMFLYS